MAKNYKSGMSLIEILIVVSVFAILGMIVSVSIISTLKSARKSEAQIGVRENLNYAVSVIERQLRGAESVSPCPNTSNQVLNYVSSDRISTSFSCQFLGQDGYIASGSARLTSEQILITSCNFACQQEDLNDPPTVIINIAARDALNQQAEGSQVTIQTEISLRNY